MTTPPHPSSPPRPDDASRPTLSLELFPPRTGPAASATWGRIDQLLATAPDFVSVTYRPTFVTEPATRPGGTSARTGAAAHGVGAGGPDGPDGSDGSGACDATTTRVRVVREHNPAEDVVAHVLATSDVPLMAHLTCIGYRKRDVVEIVTLFLSLGVRRFLALRGDPPRGTSPEDLDGELRHADDLVRVIREVEVAYFGDHDRHVQVAVAAYPAAADRAREVEVLAAKQDAGADLAITQVFYDAADYAGLTGEAGAAGVTMPILPGVIPLTDLARLSRLEALTGVPVPDDLRAALAGSTGARRVGRGIAATLDLATALLASGAPGLHLYTFNRTRPALDIVSHLRLGGILAGAAPDPAVQSAVERGYLQATPGGAPAFLHGAPGADAVHGVPGTSAPRGGAPDRTVPSPSTAVSALKEIA